MASSTTQLSFPSMRSADDELGVEALQANDAILKSFLEEFQEEHRDDEERVNSLIQSLEAEISSSPSTATMASNGSGSIDSDLTIDDFQEGSDSSGSSADHSEMGWFDMELQVPCSPSDDMNWYMDSCEYENMDCLNDSGIWVGDYSHICYGAGLEDNGYSSIWQETPYDSIMYD